MDSRVTIFLRLLILSLLQLIDVLKIHSSKQSKIKRELLQNISFAWKLLVVKIDSNILLQAIQRVSSFLPRYLHRSLLLPSIFDFDTAAPYRRSTFSFLKPITRSAKGSLLCSKHVSWSRVVCLAFADYVISSLMVCFEISGITWSSVSLYGITMSVACSLTCTRAFRLAIEFI